MDTLLISRGRGVPDVRPLVTPPVDILDVDNGFGVAKGDPGARVGDPVSRALTGDDETLGLEVTRCVNPGLGPRSFAVMLIYFDALDPSVILFESPGVFLTVGTGTGLCTCLKEGVW